MSPPCPSPWGNERQQEIPSLWIILWFLYSFPKITWQWYAFHCCRKRTSYPMIWFNPILLIWLYRKGHYTKGKGHVLVTIILSRLQAFHSSSLNHGARFEGLLVKATAFTGQSAEPPWPTWPPSPSATGNAPTALSRDSSSHRPGHYGGACVCVIHLHKWRCAQGYSSQCHRFHTHLCICTQYIFDIIFQ